MKKTSRWLIVSAVIVAGILLGFSLLRTKENDGQLSARQKPVLKVDAFVVRPTLLIDEITLTGSLLAWEEVELRNEIAGRIVQLNLPEGERVKQGTLLVKLFDDDLQATLKKLENQLAIQEKIHERQTELLDVNGISQNEYEQTGLQLNSIRADIEIQKALIRKTTILAPFDGIIGLRYVSIGAEITPSTLLATIRSQDKLKLDFSVPEKYSPVIRTGMKVTFSLYGEEQNYEARVMATEQGIDAATRNLKVRAVVSNTGSHLLPGAFANVQLKLREDPDAIVIPTQAIIPDQQTKSVIVARNGKAHFTGIETGIRQEAGVEVKKGTFAR